MRISDWSSDVCSSDLRGLAVLLADQQHEVADQAIPGLRIIGTEDGANEIEHEWLAGFAERRPDWHVDHAKRLDGLDRLGGLTGEKRFERHQPTALNDSNFQLGRPSCREQGCQYVLTLL